MLSVSERCILTKDLRQAVGDNKGATEELIIQTAERLLAVENAVNEGVPDSGKSRMTAFAEYAISMPKSNIITNARAGSFVMKSTS